MADENKTMILTFECSITSEGDIQYPKEKFKKLKDEGYENIKVEIYGSAQNASKRRGFDEKVFNKIKELQSIPDSIVLDFLSVKGSINKDFAEKFLNNN